MKIGRNDPCPCGSGKKFKKCCLNRPAESQGDAFRLVEQRLKARQIQIEQQQGSGRPIISELFNGRRFVIVGSVLYHSSQWKTFHEFLLYYLKQTLGLEWGRAEQQKKPEDQHPILGWLKLMGDHLKAHQTGPGEVFSAPMNGAISALLNLAYNLYLLGHNAEIQNRLIKRLKDPQHFEPALYETYVCAMFITAGFKIELEDEGDPRSHHGEFTAIAPISGKKYSVEAKHRKSGKDHVAIRNQVYAALRKKLPYERVVFIDVNTRQLMDKMQDVIKELDDTERTLTIDGQPAPAAYMFITNHPFIYDLTGSAFERTGFAHGFKIPTFRVHTKPMTLREAIEARKPHEDMDRLSTSIKSHKSIPSTFDGEIPFFAFNEAARAKRLLIGERYLVPSQDGTQQVGILETAEVVPTEKQVYGAYRLSNGTSIICTTPISDAELEAYNHHPETYFGVPLNQVKKTSGPLDLYDFFYQAYRSTPKERLLEFLKGVSDIEYLKTLSRDEIASIYCERLALRAEHDRNKAEGE